MICKQDRVDKNRYSNTYGQTLPFTVPCPPNIICNDQLGKSDGPSVPCALQATVTRTCILTGVRITINFANNTGLVVISKDGEEFQSNTTFIVPYIDKSIAFRVMDTGLKTCIKTVYAAPISCTSNNGLTFLRDEQIYHYESDGVTVFAIETVRIFTNGKIEIRQPISITAA